VECVWTCLVFLIQMAAAWFSFRFRILTASPRNMAYHVDGPCISSPKPDAWLKKLEWRYLFCLFHHKCIRP